MTKIKIIREENLQNFENKINELLSEGWEINGNLCIDNENHLYIVMVK